MKLSINFTLLLLTASTAAPPKIEREKALVTKDYYPDSSVLYKSQHEITSIVVPLNALNYYRDASSGSQGHSESTFFFVEADVDTDGKQTYKGLYVFKKNKATKVLENGRGAAAASDGTKQVFLASQDGLYLYQTETDEAIKYGSVADSIIGIAKPTTNDVIYILTEDRELYKVTNEGNTKTKVNEVVNAQQIGLDYRNNVYFYADDREPYVLTVDGVKKIAGLPNNPTKVNLLKPPYNIDNGVPFVVDDAVYVIYANGTSTLTGLEFQPDAKPSTYAMEGTLIQYVGYNKKIYEYNFLPLFLRDMKNFLENHTSAICALINTMRLGRHLN